MFRKILSKVVRPVMSPLTVNHPAFSKVVRPVMSPVAVNRPAFSGTSRLISSETEAGINLGLRNLPDWRKEGVGKIKNHEFTGAGNYSAMSTLLELLFSRKLGLDINISVQDLANGSIDKHPYSIGCYALYNGVVCEEDCPWSRLEKVEINEKQSEESLNVGWRKESLNGFDELVWRKKDGIVVKVMSKLVQHYVKDDFGLLELLESGPVLVEIRSGLRFMEYKDGLYVGERDFKRVQINECLTIVGADVTPEGVSYFIGQHSWGVDWGIKGFIHIRMFSCLFDNEKKDGGFLANYAITSDVDLRLFSELSKRIMSTN